MKVKATETYMKLEGDKNPLIFASPLMHEQLLKGKAIEITVVPDKLKGHLIAVNEIKNQLKKKMKKENK